MAEDNGTARVSTNESIVSSESSEKRKRRKRKWDQPAEFLVSVGAVLPGIFPMANVGSLVGASYPMVAPVSVQTTTSPQLLQASPLQQNVAQIQDELIAREMVINDAESSVRYKLTKRQTQEEIQKCTGAVVITRGKYHPPNAPPDGEKPLYLHISAGAHLKEMSERIIAIDRAASMVEEILQQSTSLEQLSSTFHVVDGAKLPQVSQSLSTCVYLGFEADLAMNVVARIRGPNDQYINHIINETGVNVLLRGRGSGDLESTQSQEQEPLHLFLCGSNSKNLEEARCLAENLLDTISTEFGASRAPSRKVYNAVPPPSQLASEVLLSQIYGKVNEYSNGAMSLSNMGSLPIPPMPSVSGPGGVTVFSQGTAIQTNLVQKPHHSVGGATCYNGYGGIYPQATPLQQVALALRQPPSCLTSAITPTTSQATTEVSASVNAVAEKKPPQRRKFQELPVTSKGSTSTPAYQGSSMQKKTEPIGARHISMMPPPLKLLHQSNGMPQSHPRSMPPAPSPLSGMMPPPPPPPKFTESAPKAEVPDKKSLISLKTEAVPETLIKLMEYGEEDDDDDDVPEERNDESLRSCINAVPTQKPFWAL